VKTVHFYGAFQASVPVNIDTTIINEYNRHMAGYFGSLGQWVLARAGGLLDFCAYNALVMRSMFHKRRGGLESSLSVLFKQVFFTGVQALPVIALVALALGAISIVQSLTQLPKFGGEAFIGKILITVIVRELGPILTGFIVIGRSGTAITTEIGNMVVQHEIEALEAMGIDPVRYLVIPRIFGVTASLVALNIYFDIFALVGGFLVSKTVLLTSFTIFLREIVSSMVVTDIAVSLLKGFIFGILVSIICTFRGFSVKLSSTEVPQMASKAVVGSITALFIADGIITFIYYF
jgi:phospholipid/cholesterol/gamma-HCH transport system permease protein